MKLDAEIARPAANKLSELDALRGIAALIVFTGHFCEGLLPKLTVAIRGTPLFTALNGPAAVIVFFVLSGFVLALQPLRTGDPAKTLILALKRWPRLAGPTTVAGLAYVVAAVIGAFPRQAGLAGALASASPPYLFWGEAQHNEQVGSVLQEALFGTFLQESAQHNGVLWTMHWEFLGSFLSFLLALVILARLPVAVRMAAFLAVWGASASYSPWLIAFPAGVLGAWIHARVGARLHIHAWSAVAMLGCGSLLLSWDIRVQSGMWAWTAWLPIAPRLSIWVVAESIAAVLCMAAALYNPAAQRWLSGTLGALAGRMSFAFYLIHLLVLCSFSSWLYILMMPNDTNIAIDLALYVTSLCVTVLAATPLTFFDQWWIGLLARTSHAAAVRLRLRPAIPAG